MAADKNPPYISPKIIKNATVASNIPKPFTIDSVGICLFIYYIMKKKILNELEEADLI
jgi:hypothetical protein